MLSNVSQLAFDFNTEPSFAKEDFVVSATNDLAYKWLELWPEREIPSNKGRVLEPFYGLYLYGPAGSGKTHLAEMWANRVHALTVATEEIWEWIDRIVPGGYYLLEDCHHIENEEGFFHFLNRVKECQARLLMTSRVPVPLLPLMLPDLRSRLHALPTLPLYSADEDLLRGVLAKLFMDKQLRVRMEVIDFLMTRIERGIRQAEIVVDFLDKEAMYRKRAVTLPFAKEVLTQAGMI